MSVQCSGIATRHVPSVSFTIKNDRPVDTAYVVIEMLLRGNNF